MNKVRYILLGAGCIVTALCFWLYNQSRKIEAKRAQMQDTYLSIKRIEKGKVQQHSWVIEMTEQRIRSLREENERMKEEKSGMEESCRILESQINEKLEDLRRKQALYERNKSLKQIIQRLENTSVSYENRVYRAQLGAMLRMIYDGSDINMTWSDSGGMTALHYASFLDLPYVRSWLIEHGANVTARTDDGLTPKELFFTRHKTGGFSTEDERDSEEFISSIPGETGSLHLKSEGVSKLPQEDTTAIRKGGNTLLTIFTSPSTGQIHTDLQPMIDRLRALKCREATSALYQKRLLTLLPLIRDGADVDITLPETKGNTALHYACGIGSWSITQWLVEHGANVNAVTDKGATPLDCVGSDNTQQIRALLISRGARKNK